MRTHDTTAPAKERPGGRTYFWAGIGLCLLGPALCVVQYSLKLLIVPWYVPALTTLGAILVLCSVARRRSTGRKIALVLIAALATYEWFFLATQMKLPAYEGPARAGQPFPAFRTTLADGRPFTEKDLQDGRASVLVFFRGRW